jgi:hypothetical protein
MSFWHPWMKRTRLNTSSFCCIVRLSPVSHLLREFNEIEFKTEQKVLVGSLTPSTTSLTPEGFSYCSMQVRSDNRDWKSVCTESEKMRVTHRLSQTKTFQVKLFKVVCLERESREMSNQRFSLAITAQEILSNTQRDKGMKTSCSRHHHDVLNNKKSLGRKKSSFQNRENREEA